MEDSKSVEFSFGWLALKLLGKSLYSNAWSAISELVANGFDAKASEVYVYINNSQKGHATIEIIDNGTGMTNEEISTYVKVGYNKRESLEKANDPNSDEVMGRKGIGKLAALYLSDNYYLITKTLKDSSSWQMHYIEDKNDENQHPFLLEVTETVNLFCKEKWESITTGTFLKLTDVNLNGLGDAAFQSLENKLSNHFFLNSMENKNIFLCVQSNYNSTIGFKKVEKSIAFKNMAYIEYSTENNQPLMDKIAIGKDLKITLPYSKVNEEFKHKIEYLPFKSTEQFPLCGEYSANDLSGKIITKPYTLQGWIGIHSSISLEVAKNNDENFTKNKFYNPIQLRLYVRNKLAVENFLNMLNSTQAFVNYIEGEINFNLLDDNDFPDIATSNRQGLDEHDERVELLKNIVNSIIQDLIQKRHQLSDEMNASQKIIIDRQYTSAKTQFSQEVEKEVEKFDNLTSKQKSDLTLILTNKVQGDVTPKSNYVVFFSHSRADKIFTDFLYRLLLKRGVFPQEIFYTSRDDDPSKYENIMDLSIQIKNNIIRDNVLLVYLTSKDYKESEYCMFEGGAGWATRSVGDYILLSLRYEDIPKYLTNGKSEFCMLKNDNIVLDREIYLYMVKVLNEIITHINDGRKIQGQSAVDVFQVPNIPEDIELYKEGKSIRDYMDPEILRYWDFYVGKDIEKYLSSYRKQKDVAL